MPLWLLAASTCPLTKTSDQFPLLERESEPIHQRDWLRLATASQCEKSLVVCALANHVQVPFNKWRQNFEVADVGDIIREIG
jgi:hypothetical protein